MFRRCGSQQILHLSHFDIGQLNNPHSKSKEELPENDKLWGPDFKNAPCGTWQGKTVTGVPMEARLSKDGYTKIRIRLEDTWIIQGS